MNLATKLFSTFFLNIIMFSVSFVISIILSRVLGPENYGIYRYILLIASTITLLSNFGLPEMLQLQLAKKIINLKDYLASTLLSTMPIYLLVTSLLFYYLFSANNVYDKPLILSGLYFCLLYQLNSIFHNAIYALDKILKFQLLEILKQSSFLLITILLYLINFLNIANIFWILVFSNSFSIIYILYINFKTKYKKKVMLAYSKNLFKNSLRAYLNNLLTFMTFRLDLYILKYYVGFYEIGIYSLAVTLVEKLWLFPDSVRSVLYLELSNERQGDDFVAKVLRILTLVILVSGLLIGFLSYYIIPLVFSEKFRDSVLPFIILLPGIMFFCYSKLLASYFIVKDLIKINTYSSIIITIINLSLNVLLIPKFFVAGASIATSIAYIVGSLYHIKKFSSISNIELKSLFIIKKNDFKILKIIKSC